MNKFNLSFVLLAGLAVRLWGLNWGLPLRLHVDEVAVVHYSTRISTGLLNPAPFFDYPSLHLYLLALLFGLYFFVHLITGQVVSLEEHIKVFLNDPSRFYLEARMFTVVLALMTIWLLWRTTRRFFGERTALLAALALAIHPVHVLHSHYGTVDVSNSFFILAAFAAIGWINSSTETRKYIIAGICCGLAAGIKYFGGVIFLPLVGIHIFLCRRNKKHVISKNIFLALGAFLGAFALTSPFLWLDPGNGFARWQAQYTTHVHWQTFQGSWLALGKDLWHNAHPFVMVSAIFGMAKSWKNQNQGLVLGTLTVLGFFLVMGTISSSTGRNALPYYPILFLVAFGAFAPYFSSSNKKIRILSASTAVVLISLLYLPRSLKADIILSKPDTRLKALIWIRNHVPPGSKILRFPHTPEFQKSDPYRVKVDWEGRLLEADPKVLLPNYDYFLLSSFGESFPRYPITDNTQMLAEFRGQRLGDFHNPVVRVYGKS